MLKLLSSVFGTLIEFETTEDIAISEETTADNCSAYFKMPFQERLAIEEFIKRSAAEGPKNENSRSVPTCKLCLKSCKEI